MNKNNTNNIYKYWKIRIFYSIFVGYIFFYLTRKNFTFLIPIIINDIKISISDIGIISTLFYITYGISKLICGIIS
ncbi:MAG: MFS transporter family glucose-6-phosphate receptor UhpC, partial [Deltaproteobacteria bacterium]